MSRSDFFGPSSGSEIRDVEPGEERPRVVIFESNGEPTVEILELPESATLGDIFRHCGTEWQVTATRTGDRVLIARPTSG